MLFTALIPVFLIILMGFGFARSPLSTPSMWGDMERLTYYLFFPCLLVARLSGIVYDGPMLIEIGAVVAVALILMTGLVLVGGRFVPGMLGATSSVFQSSIRFNAYMGLAIIDALYGDQGLVLAALCIAVSIPLVNALSLTALVMDGRRSSVGLMHVPGAIVMNPLVVASVIGLSISYAGSDLPSLIKVSLNMLGQVALPLGLLAVGGSIRPSAMGAHKIPVLASVVSKLVLFPLLILMTSRWFGLDTGLVSVLLILACLPAPPSALILAAQTGGNVAMTANIITAQTLAAGASLLVWVQVASLL